MRSRLQTSVDIYGFTPKLAILQFMRSYQRGSGQGFAKMASVFPSF